jgi:DNA-binding MarR family transcriptional regulator
LCDSEPRYILRGYNRKSLSIPDRSTIGDNPNPGGRHGRVEDQQVPAKTARPASPLSTQEYARLAAFRLSVRAFLHFSEQAAAEVGLTGQHYQALLALRACPPEQPCTINDLAQQLFLKHNSTVALVDRLEAEGLVVREPSSTDRRKVELHITARGARVLGKLAERHRAKLQGIGPDLERFFRELPQDSHAPEDVPAPAPARRRVTGASRGAR